MKKVLIVGATGQDGAYLSKLLLEKGFKVIGTSRDASVCDTSRLKKLNVLDDIKLISLAPNDFRNVLKVISTFKPSRIYNLSGQTSVGLSFDQPVECIDSIAGATLNFLEALRFFSDDIKFFNAGSSECYGNINNHQKATEESSFMPRSPYAIAKSTAYWLVSNYRESYNIFCCTGILSNHESPLRNKRFVTKKIVSAAHAIKNGEMKFLLLGNINIYRDWGWAPDYIKAIWLMMQRNQARDFIIGSGKTYSLREFVNKVFRYLNISKKNLRTNVSKYKRKIDLRGYKANIVETQKVLKWKPSVKFDTIIYKMINNELF